ncbi:MAG TPA: C25 family cysteine peptidase [Edaphocola sp.]|nr:C25 family cysteine peptidase [Edaphocola sp.]
MKQLVQLSFLLALGFIFAQKAKAQSTFGNEWIHLGNTYKKVKIARKGIYRISAAELNALGFSNVPGSQFALFRDGKEVPLYTSTAGNFSGNDYIEFYAYPATGGMNTELYPQPGLQPDTVVNLFTDSAAYYLTHDNSAHKRLALTSNSIPNPAPTAASYCWATSFPTANRRTYLSFGESYDVNSAYYFYSSDFDFGEGYAYNTRTQLATSLTFSTQGFASTSGQAAQLSFVLASNTNLVGQTHNLTVKKGSNLIFDTTFAGYSYIRKTVNIPNADIGSSSTAIAFNDAAYYSLYMASIRYPHSFDFNGTFTNNAAFELNAGERYLSIANFSAGNAAPILFDLTNNKIYTGTTNNNQLQFYLDNDPGKKELYLASAGSITDLASFQDVQFKDYSQAVSQGNYIILTHKDYIDALPDYVQQYKTYRASAAGGGFAPVIVDVTGLYDQFGYGYDFDPMSIRRFIKYAEANWQTTPEYLFIIGKGIYYSNYSSYLAQRSTYTYPVVPTWGHPGSDNLLSAFNNSQKPTLATGRLSVYNNQEIGDYLDKVRAYDLAIKSNTLPSAATELWKKRALHIAGSSDLGLQQHLLNTLNTSGQTYKDTLIGGIVRTISKTSTDPTENVDNPAIDSLINNGVNVITFYGHASAAGFDYNLNDPNLYNANPRFPIFLAFGCDVAQIYSLTNDKTISEDYIHSENGGAIAMLAENNYGYTSILPQYMENLYLDFCQKDYGATFGKQYQLNINSLQGVNTGTYMDIHTQCMLLQGDPAIHIYNPEKPDYDVETEAMSSNPVNISTSSDSFDLKVVVYNLGKAIKDTVTVTLAHTHMGNNTITFADTVKVPDLFNTDTLHFTIPVDPLKDIGLNNYTVKIDPENKFEETSEQNNQATLQVYIYANNLIPVYPAKFAIVHQQGVTLKASTLNAFAPAGKYRFQIDTTAKFNSPLLQQTAITSLGGVLKWTPNLILQDSMVYYWRTAPDSAVNGAIQWSQSSFIYLANGSDGWNQSHYYQYLNDDMEAIELPESSRKFTFAPLQNNLILVNKVIYPPTNDYFTVRQTLNDVILDQWGCGFSGSIRIMVIDKTTGKPWKNTTTGPGKYGSIHNCGHSDYVFEFYTKDLAGRDSAIKMIQRVPQGDYIMVANLIYGITYGANEWDRTTINEWMADTAVLGSGNSLYHAIKNLGFTDIDQFNSRKSFIFFRKKGDNTYPVYQEISPDSTSKITLQASFNSYPDTGKLLSTIIGPAKEWQQLIWKRSTGSPDPQNDYPFINVYGIDSQGHETKVYSGKAQDTALNFISAEAYPKMRLIWNSVDTANRTSADLHFWRVLYKPLPEAALNGAARLVYTDSINEGQEQEIRVAIENLTPYPMDSMLVKYKIIDSRNVAHLLTEKRYKKLTGNDTLVASLDFNADQYPGKNFLYIEANPDNDQPEQYHPNNIGYLPFLMNADKINPLLDVTFDGVHILDKDIVSAKPLIKILLKDNSRYNLLNDTSGITVQLLKPNETAPESISFDGSICKFFPATANGNGENNIARVEYRPVLKEDGVYKLIVTGKDKAGNIAENAPKYEVQFTVENKPSITNVLNYPNPFSTSTQFLFTLTGSEIPSQFKIQILTITGKVVREITKDELGPLHIGRNMTDYHWDGRDQYGQLLGNGVYLYRVITSIRGNDIDHRSDAAVDKFFKNGYGKLYIMR